MERTRLGLGLAAVFAGLTTLLVATALAYQPFLLLVAIPFAATAGFIWYHASGRLRARFLSEARRDRSRRERRRSHAGFGAGPRETGGASARQRRASRRYERRTGSGTGTRSGQQPDPHGLSRREAYDVLGLAPDASADEIKRAYRARVKETHPDTDAGDEDAFKRVNRAYETLTE